MNNREQYHFILIDDSKLDCFIGEKVIQNNGACRSFQSFSDAQNALEHIKIRPIDESKTILLVDINMPLMTGFEFIESFEKNIPEDKQPNYIINLLSSSINQSDIIRAKSYKSVHDFLNKPIKKDTLQAMIDSLSA